MKNKDLKRRILEISYKHKLSHLGSCLTAVDIIDEIYSIKKNRNLNGSDEKFVLSNGHAGLALYVVLEKYYPFIDGELLFEKHGVHPNRDVLNYIDCSTGSLGQGLPIAVGMALADRSKNVYCLISDGECAEGSVWEALRIAEDYELENLHIYLNQNGWGAYNPIERDVLEERLEAFDQWGDRINFVWTDVLEFPFLKGQDAHYYTMTEDDYKVAMEVLK